MITQVDTPWIEPIDCGWLKQDQEDIICKPITGEYLSFDCSPDGKTFLFARQHKMWLYDPENQQVVYQFNNTPNYISQTLYSPNGKLIASLEHKNTINLWSAHTRELLLTIDRPTIGSKIKFSPNSDSLLLKASQKLTILCCKTGAELRVINLRQEIHCILYSYNGKQLIFPYDYVIQILDLRWNRIVKIFKNHNTRHPKQIEQSSKGELIISGDRAYIFIWHRTSLQIIRKLYQSGGEFYNNLCQIVSPNQNILISQTYTKMYSWDLNTGQNSVIYHYKHDTICSCQFQTGCNRTTKLSPDRKFVALISCHYKQTKHKFTLSIIRLSEKQQLGIV